jgi:hypothetical protein
MESGGSSGGGHAGVGDGGDISGGEEERDGMWAEGDDKWGAEEEEEEAGDLPWSTVEDVRDACIMATVVGHVGLCVRTSVVASLKAPAFADTECNHPDCTVAGCKGNRLEEAPPPAAATRAAAGNDAPSYRLVVPHHKTSVRGKVMPPIPITSPKLVSLLRVWCTYGRPQVRTLIPGHLCRFKMCACVRARKDHIARAASSAGGGGVLGGKSPLAGPGQPVHHKQGRHVQQDELLVGCVARHRSYCITSPRPQ